MADTNETDNPKPRPAADGGAATGPDERTEAAAKSVAPTEAVDTEPSDAQAKSTASKSKKKPVNQRPELKSRKTFWFELPILVLVAVLVAVLVRTFLVQTFYIPSRSMENTLLENDRVLVNKVVYDFRDPRRGEVIVFKPPASWNVGPNKDDFIKRIIGVGGDHVVCCDSDNRITINGTPLTENYLYPGDEPSQEPFDITVPKGRLWVMGDHRSASADSRAHIQGDPKNQGTIPEGSVVGRAFAIFWPINRAAWLSVPKAFDKIHG